jgi:hypothetical protein
MVIKYIYLFLIGLYNKILLFFGFNKLNPANSANPANSTNSANPANSTNSANPANPANLANLVNKDELRGIYIEKYQNKYDNSHHISKQRRIDRQLNMYDKMTKVDNNININKDINVDKNIKYINEGDTCEIKFMEKVTNAKIRFDFNSTNNYRTISRMVANELSIGSKDIFGRPIDVYINGNIHESIYACLITVNGIVFNNAVINNDEIEAYVVLNSRDINFIEVNNFKINKIEKVTSNEVL